MGFLFRSCLKGYIIIFYVHNSTYQIKRRSAQVLRLRKEMKSSANVADFLLNNNAMNELNPGTK